MAYAAYGMMWVATAAAVCIGLWLTQNPNCLWALLIPALVSLKNVTVD